MTTDTKAHITLRAMEQFVAVAEELHFHRAAARLNMSQPPLTSAIRKLEGDINVTLIERGNRVLGLTPAGKRFLDEAYETLRRAEQAITATRDVAAGRAGLVRLGYVGSSLYGRLPDVIREFRTSHPEVRLELREATTAAQIGALRDGTLDVGVLIPPLTNAEDIEQIHFDSDRLCMAIPKDHPLCRRPALTLADLSDEPFILWPMVEGRGFHLQVIRLCANAGFVPRVTQEAHGMHAVLSLVAVGGGVSIVPESMSGFQGDRIGYRALSGSEAQFDLVLGYRNLSPSAEAFIRTTE
ncbi:MULTISPECIES: LysR family transcriptional regulator [Halomonadaceae]|uniref:LysR family transcriptional regulator n=1 Tax=Halomonadaceae TaxID=28256 RepID=UPI0012F23A46|nr:MULTISPECIES: LysR family transcriptional regulator [Halomonas]CAD5248524.1 LysR family transcriptional regulator [Halomonas sp. 59]CAD5248632.1 LysR family transcriptional regulator [Halomonas sp. 113]CAD5251756.1 LysR family transcriptional regulator [Halomonas sp. 156]CAD5257065.1 LysR family transcriptional regulator [Halomonas sp. I3]VXC00975.1 LysR family transcriptional regulator [Halomonas titanicae]